MQTIVSLVDVPLDADVARLELDHRVARRFRWLVLLELALALTIGLCALPLVVLLVVFGGGGELILPDVDDIARRAWVRWREVRGRVVAADASTTELAAVAIDSDRYAGALAHLLQRAHTAGVTVVERISGGPPTALWFGGQPLLQAPSELDAARARRVLEAAGVRIEEGQVPQTGGASLTLTLDEPQPSRIAAVLGVVLLGPIWVWTAGGRSRIAACLAALGGHDHVHALTVDGGGLHHIERRGDQTLAKRRIDRADLLGMVWGRVLGDAPTLRIRGPLLRVASKTGVRDLHLPLDPAAGDALCDLLRTAAHRLWHLQAGAGQAARCPYCATVYTFAPGSGCPSCGAPPSALHGLAS